MSALRLPEGLTLDRLINRCICVLEDYYGCGDDERYANAPIYFKMPPSPYPPNLRAGYGCGMRKLAHTAGPYGAVNPYRTEKLGDPALCVVEFSALKVLRWANRQTNERVPLR